MVFGSSTEVEAIGIREAVLWLEDKRVTQSIVETDAKAVVDALHSSMEDILELGQLISDCKQLLSRNHFTLQHMKGNANEAADALAKLAISLDSLYNWEDASQHIHQIVSRDIPILYH